MPLPVRYRLVAVASDAWVLLARNATAEILAGGSCDSSDAPEPTDQRIYEAHEQVYEAHEQFEDDPEDLHYEVGDVIEEARRAEQQRDKQYHRQDHERSG